MSDKIQILLDTDPASDIDDAVAIAYLLNQPRCELLGITTVSGDVAKRAACAEMLCREMGRSDIPIHAGLSEPMLVGTGQPNVPQYEAVKKRPHRLDYQKNYAVQFLRATIRQNPGKITLLSIGPFTNIATLFALDPDIPWMLKGFVSMAGQFFEGQKREWNVHVDATASTLIYNRNWGYQTPHINVGLDVTTKCQMPAEEVRQRFTPKPLNVALEMAEVWFQHSKTITFHDPLAAALIFDPDICRYAAGRIVSPLDANKDTAGRTEFVEDPQGPHKVCTSVDSKRFFDHFFGVFK